MRFRVSSLQGYFPQYPRKSKPPPPQDPTSGLRSNTPFHPPNHGPLLWTFNLESLLTRYGPKVAATNLYHLIETLRDLLQGDPWDPKSATWVLFACFRPRSSPRRGTNSSKERDQLLEGCKERHGLILVRRRPGQPKTIPDNLAAAMQRAGGGIEF